MATVYVADDIKHDRRVALKVLKPEIASAVGGQRFLAEIRTTAQLQHPHILPLFDSGDADGFLYFVMPYVEGESLRERLDRVGGLEVDEALRLTEDISAALAHAHGRGVVHRDIKPANILISDGGALVADFGIARALAFADEAHLTGTGILIGTPQYMSPEQIEGTHDIDGRSDIYAMGCLLYEMLTGAAPFAGKTAQAVITKAITAPTPSVRDSVGELSAALDAAVRRAMAKDREERFDTPQAFAEACLASASSENRRSKGSRVRALASVGAVTVAIVLAGIFGWRAVQTANARASLAEIRELATAGQYVTAFEKARRAERWLEEDAELVSLLPQLSNRLTVTTDPPGAVVTVEPLSDDGTPGVQQRVGTTPVSNHLLPRVDYRVTVELEGYLPASRIASTELEREMGTLIAGFDVVELSIDLRASDGDFPEMVAVPGGDYVLSSPDAPIGLSVELAPFLIDRFEVTNEDFAAFVEADGYADEAFWAGVPLSIRQTLLDRTGLPGPRDWVGQRPDDSGSRFPVTGVSWYEASAFCAWAGKRLPTVYEWEKTARDGRSSRIATVMPWGFQGPSSPAVQRANFDSDGPVAVDAYPFGISPYGAYAMAGNVREWTANVMGDGRAATGGGWDGPSYLATEYDARSPESAAPALGFRCAYSEGSGDQGAGFIDLEVRTPTYTPVDEATFRTLLDFYRYDPVVPNPRLASIEETPSWTRERLWIDGPEGDSILVYVYTPQAVSPPLQTILFVPGSNAFSSSSVPTITEDILGGVLRAGRAVVAPVIHGMVERPFPPTFAIPDPPTVAFRDLMVLHATELRIALDYATTRGDIDLERVAFLGVSFGAGSRLPLSVVDDRYAAAIYVGAGIDERVKPTLPEADNVNFAPYIRVPKLVLNGAADEEHPWTSRGLPLWNLLSEPKELVLVEGGGHVLGPEDRIPAINGFLDRVFGPVRR